MRKFNLYYLLFYCLYHGKYAFKAKFETEDDVLRSVNYMLVSYITSFIFFSLFNFKWIRVLGEIKEMSLYVVLGIAILIISLSTYLINKQVLFKNNKYSLILTQYDEFGISKTTCKVVTIFLPSVTIAYMTLTGIFYLR